MSCAYAHIPLKAFTSSAWKTLQINSIFVSSFVITRRSRSPSSNTNKCVDNAKCLRHAFDTLHARALHIESAASAHVASQFNTQTILVLSITFRLDRWGLCRQCPSRILWYCCRQYRCHEMMFSQTIPTLDPSAEIETRKWWFDVDSEMYVQCCFRGIPES